MIGNRLKARALYYSLLTIVAIEVVLGLILLLAVWGLADLIFPIGLIALVQQPIDVPAHEVQEINPDEIPVAEVKELPKPKVEPETDDF